MRKITSYIVKDLRKKMVFLSGPRQCGKTTLAEDLISDHPGLKGRYFNWDDDDDRNIILKKLWSDQTELLVFDELHKFTRWKNWIKGLYDKQKKIHQFLITGSARLDVYRRGGDSLLGRYHYWRLHPFTLDEHPAKISDTEAFNRLMTVGGFPEPFLENDAVYARRWRKDRLERLIKQDVRDMEGIKDLSKIELLLDLLRRRVGSPIVMANLAEDLQVASKTVKHWIEALARLYIIFLVEPYSKKISRTLSKQPKIYFYDNGDVLGDEGARFKNLVATHLLKHIQFLEDSEGLSYRLKHLRDKEKHEVDFVITLDDEVDQLLEAKWADTTISAGLKYFSERLKPKKPSVQLLGIESLPYEKNGIRVVSATGFLKNHLAPHR